MGSEQLKSRPKQFTRSGGKRARPTATLETKQIVKQIRNANVMTFPIMGNDTPKRHDLGRLTRTKTQTIITRLLSFTQFKISRALKLIEFKFKFT